ncbi:MAG: ATP-binding cassette domain-containing protein [Acidimicrobiales bacterium]
MTEFAVETLDIVRTFKDGDVRALDEVTLRVPRGEVFGLLGPNGSGKTTMIRILSTILTPSSGNAMVNGIDVEKDPQRVRQSIGLAGQFATVDENLTGFENLRMVGRLNHLDKTLASSRSRELLGEFGLADAANRSAKTYSGGMRRRLDLAAALVADPPILFLDEPTTGLDPQSRQDLWAIIEGLTQRGVTVLLTTQYLEEADRLARQLVVLDHGRIIAEGTSQELKARLGTTVLELHLTSTQDAAAARELLANLSATFSNIEGTALELTVNDGPAVAAEALRRLDGASLKVAGLALREPSLDDVFLSLTGHRAENAAAVEPARRARSQKEPA